MNEGSRPTVTSNPREPGSESTGLETKTNHDARRIPIDPRDPPRLRAVPRVLPCCRWEWPKQTGR